MLIVHYLNTDNRKNNYLVSGEGTTHDIHGNFGTQKKKFSSDRSKVRTKFYLSLHRNSDNNYLFNRREICKFKANN